MEVHIKEKESKGFAMAREDNKRAGVMTYSIPSSDFIIRDHTEVEPSFMATELVNNCYIKS